MSINGGECRFYFYGREDFSEQSKKGTGGGGRDRNCRKLLQIVVTCYDEFLTINRIYDVL